MELISSWPSRADDVLLLAGDVSNDLSIMRSTLELLRDRFKEVFFCPGGGVLQGVSLRQWPGNHDLWLHNKAGRSFDLIWALKDGCVDSVEKFWPLGSPRNRAFSHVFTCFH